MSGFSRLAAAAALVAGFATMAQAQSHSWRAPADQGQFYALDDSGYYVPDRSAVGGVVPPSESHTVMGLRVPR